jgi:hypothetical protein
MWECHCIVVYERKQIATTQICQSQAVGKWSMLCLCKKRKTLKCRCRNIFVITGKMFVLSVWKKVYKTCIAPIKNLHKSGHHGGAWMAGISSWPGAIVGKIMRPYLKSN